MNSSSIAARCFSRAEERPCREAATVAKKNVHSSFLDRGQSRAFLGVLRVSAVKRSWCGFVPRARPVQVSPGKKSRIALLLLSVLLVGMDNTVPEADERRRLEEQQSRISSQIEALKEEQGYLSFQRSIAGSDSKYLLLDLSTGSGTLKYRNRVLRTFRFTLVSAQEDQLKRGRYVLTGKSDGPVTKMSLTFQDSFVIHGKWYSGKGAGKKRLAGLVVRGRDLAAIYYAVEQGSMLYIYR